MAHTETDIVGGIDTYKDSHTVAALSGTGRLLGTAQFPATPDGYQELLTWLRGFGQLVRVGMEGTGSYGAGLHGYLRLAGVEVREVIRPKRQVRRRRGKSDPVDAEAAARGVIAGDDLGIPKRQDGSVEAIRVLRLTRRSALKARTQAANQLHAIIHTSPSPLREQLRSLRLPELVKRVRRFRCTTPTTPIAAARFALRNLAERWTAGADIKSGKTPAKQPLPLRLHQFVAASDHPTLERCLDRRCIDPESSQAPRRRVRGEQ